jgi:predicted kinase
MSRCKIVLAVGLPGSGKSTCFERMGVNAISSDALRLQLADDPTEQSIHRQVFRAVRYLLRERLALQRPVTYIDATNLTVKERRRYLKIARDHRCEIEALYFDVSPEVCKARNAGRPRVVPPEAIDRMAARLTRPTTAEGFTRVQIVKG